MSKLNRLSQKGWIAVILMIVLVAVSLSLGAVRKATILMSRLSGKALYILVRTSRLDQPLISFPGWRMEIL